MTILHDVLLAIAHWILITTVLLLVVAVRAWWTNRAPSRAHRRGLL